MVGHQSEQSDTRVFVVPVDCLVNCFRPFHHADPTADEPGLLDRHVGDHGTPAIRPQDEPIHDGCGASAEYPRRRITRTSYRACRDVSVLAFLILVASGVTVGGVRDEMVRGGELDQLLRSDEDARRRWLDRRQPAPPEANWWLYLLLLIDERWAHRPAERPAWAQLKIRLLGQAGRRSALGQAEVAERTAYYVAQMRDAGMVASSLPAADTVVRACLDAIPVSLDHVAVLTDRQNLHALDH